MKYRPEIDGLRAIAVLPVIFFHAGWKVFAGGFIGVDVFFVISGYLITSIIIEDHNAHGFSIIKFYERRARRILPALFLVVLVCILLAWMSLSADEMKTFSRGVAAVSVFASNFLFWRESGYFNVASEFNPLIHTWSLAVEEQFYLLFPLFLVAVLRFGKKWVGLTLAVVGVASFALCQWGLMAKPVAAFFLLPTRAWELAIGALIAIYLFNRSGEELPRMAREVLGALGLFFIALGVGTFDAKISNVGLFMLAATIGAGLVVLFATPGTYANRLLCWRPLVGLGLISYSTYLWHQPLFAFARQTLYRRDPWVFVVLSVAAIVLAYITWKYVERPARDRSFLSRRTIFRGALAATVCLFAFGMVGSNYAEGFPNRPAAQKLEWLVYDLSRYDYRPCPIRLQNQKLAPDTCYVTRRGDATAAIFGDSHAADKFFGLEKFDTRHRWMLAANNGCPPVLDVDVAWKARALINAPHCRERSEVIVTWLAAQKNIRTVFLSYFGNISLTAFFARDHALNELGLDKLTISAVGAPQLSRRDAIYRGLEHTVAALLRAGKQVVIAIDMPELPFFAQRLHAGPTRLPLTVWSHAQAAAGASANGGRVGAGISSGSGVRPDGHRLQFRCVQRLPKHHSTLSRLAPSVRGG